MDELQGDPQHGSNAVKRLFTSLGEDLPRVFPRRTVGWHDCSPGRRRRIRYLSSNPYLLRDLDGARSWLGLNDHLFRIDWEAREYSESLRPSTESFQKSGFVFVETAVRVEQLSDHAITSDLVAAFIAAYVGVLSGNSEPDSRNPAPRAIVAAAEQVADSFSRRTNMPEWVRPDVVGPIEAVIRAIVRRYQLPGWVTRPIVFALITGSTYYLEDLPEDHVSVLAPEYTYQTGGYDLTVHGVDEFMTRERWDELYDRFVLPSIADDVESRGHMRVSNPGVNDQEFRSCLPLLAELMKTDESLSDVVARHPELERDHRTVERRIEDWLKLLRPDSKM